MDDPKQTLSVARIIDREKFYKRKALQLEQELIFANEQVTVLEQELATLEMRVGEAEGTEQKLKAIQKDYEELKQRYDQEKKTYQQLELDLQKEITQLKRNQRSDHDVNGELYEKKIKGYERLLAEIQTEIVEKDREIDIYKKRIMIMEKRLKQQGNMDIKQQPDLNNDPQIQVKDERALAYLDYAMILSEKRSVIRGELIVENVGAKPLGTPYICFRFTPGDAAVIKGRILSWATMDSESIQENWQWVFLDNEWAEEAKERGELWVYPTQPITIAPSDRVILSDLQIPIERKYYDQLSVEIFIYFPNSEYRVKAVNQILVNF